MDGEERGSTRGEGARCASREGEEAEEAEEQRRQWLVAGQKGVTNELSFLHDNVNLLGSIIVGRALSYNHGIWISKLGFI